MRPGATQGLGLDPAAHGFSAGWSVPEGRCPTGANIRLAAHGTAGVEGSGAKSSSIYCCGRKNAERTFCGPSIADGPCATPTSQRNRPVRVVVVLAQEPVQPRFHCGHHAVGQDRLDMDRRWASTQDFHQLGRRLVEAGEPAPLTAGLPGSLLQRPGGRPRSPRAMKPSAACFPPTPRPGVWTRPRAQYGPEQGDQQVGLGCRSAYDLRVWGVRRQGLEPRTVALRGHCSAN
jgi:hypothetical protein